MPGAVQRFVAHSANPAGERQELVAHLRNVSELAAGFAVDLRAGEFGRYLGLWHDVGKFSRGFQEYLRACERDGGGRRGPDHKGAGAVLAARQLPVAGLLVQGHHGGLRAPVQLAGWLAERERDPAVTEALRLAAEAISGLEPADQLVLPGFVQSDRLRAEVFLRLLFSALVDADFLDTERHFSGERGRLRGSWITLEELWERFRASRRGLAQGSDEVRRVRAEVYEGCLAAAESPPGLFRLTVPTGGGKTLSGMGFALRHALRHGQRRVIVAVPFISITEQTADVYRGVFERAGDPAPVVLEHHSAVTDGSDGDARERDTWRRVTAENWDAPVVVTTTVQLFESLFANGTSGCRKLHNIVGSVLVLDEAQALPPPLLAPILDVLRQLCEDYGTSVVLSTATQPAFEAIEEFARLPAREIVPEPGRLFTALRRVQYEWWLQRQLSWAKVAELMGGESQALAVLNTRADARALLQALGDPEALHLSTWLCGAHRRAVIAEVRERLAAGRPCRLVSTQVIEAGVDLDFPCVLRAVGPLDSVIQAAGRCNREGRRARGRMIVFRSEGEHTPAGPYRTATDITAAIMHHASDPDDPRVTRRYFEQLFEAVDTDRERIQPLRATLDYPEVARTFRMIDEQTESVVVPYGSAGERARAARAIAGLRAGSPAGRLLVRELQPYLVNIPASEAERERHTGRIAPVLDGLGEWRGDYDVHLGLGGAGERQ